MGDLARLYQELNWKQRDRLAQGGGGALKGRITASPSGGELLLKGGKRLSIQDDREGFRKGVDGNQRDRTPCNLRVFEQERNERRRHSGQVDGQKDRVPRRGRSENRANTAQRTEP